MSSERKKWKGRFVTDALYKKRLKQTANGSARKKEVMSRDTFERLHIEGNRIVNFEVLFKNLICASCGCSLNILRIENEVMRGLSSILKIRCETCLYTSDVKTGPTHQYLSQGQEKFDLNSKAALAALDTGIGHTHLEKILRTLDIPCMTAKTFKRCEREMGKVVESVAKESCTEAAKEERILTVQNLSTIVEDLPEGKGIDFLVPGCNTSDVRDDQSVGVMGSIDMGYSGRANGYTYDSLNGYSACIGSQTGRVLDYATTNRKCRQCDLGYDPAYHDCRLNFYGSAKAMEARAAVILATQSDVFKDQNIHLGIFVGDNDSSSMCAIKRAATNPIHKLSDMNHTSKGVKNMLYKIAKQQDDQHELTNDAILFLQRCFTYAVAQNSGDKVGLAAAIKNIPFHAFNQHDTCGDWCGFLKNPETYEHQTIPGGFRSASLFETLKLSFSKLADNADQFSTKASTQANESLNSIMIRKAPKATCYSLSESADFRFACAVGQKNKGSEYVLRVIEKASMDPGVHCKKLVENKMKIDGKRKKITTTREFKKNRRERKKIRSQLRFRREGSELDTYERHMGLFAAHESEKENWSQNELPDSTTTLFLSDDFSIVYFDLETAGLQRNCDVLQIAMKCGDEIFNEYIDPQKFIPTKVTDINGLSNIGKELYYFGRRVQSSTISVVMDKLLLYLRNFNRLCILVAHNCAFDAPRLLRVIYGEKRVDEFRNVIAGFVDTLPMFKKHFPDRKGKGKCTLTTLASETMSLNVQDAHNAIYDVYLLQELVQYHFGIEDVMSNETSFDEELQLFLNRDHSQEIIRTLLPLEAVLSKILIKRLADAGIDYDLLVATFHNEGKEKTTALLEQRKNGKPQAIKTKSKINIILEFLRNESEKSNLS